MEWEYIKESDISIQSANELGRQGWELIQIIEMKKKDGTNIWFWIFKRLKQ